MPKTIGDFVHLTQTQSRILNFLNKEPTFHKHFYFTGGTLLKALNIVPRESNDLDFFTFADIKPLQFPALLKAVGDILKRELGETTLSVTPKGWLHNPSGMLLDFVLDQTDPIDTFSSYENIKTVGLKDIAAHKASALCSRDEMKDLIDVAYLTKTKRWLLKNLAEFAEEKWHIGMVTEEKLLEELLAKKKMFVISPNLFISEGKKNVQLVKLQIDYLLNQVRL